MQFQTGMTKADTIEATFHNLKRRAAGKTNMAKLRRDMFDWFYADHMEIHGYDKAGRDESEAQDRFD